MSAAEGRADEASAKRIAYLGPSSVLATWSSPVAWMVGFAEKADVAATLTLGLSRADAAVALPQTTDILFI